MDNDKVVSALASLETAISYQTEMLQQLREEDEKLKKDVDSLKHSRSRLRGILAGLGLMGGTGAATGTGLVEKLFG